MSSITDNKLVNGLRAEGPLYREAAKNMVHKPVVAGEKAKDIKVAFQGQNIATRLTVLSGGISGATLALQGARSIKKSMEKDEHGQRDWQGALVGAGQVAGGAIATALFYERLKVNGNDPERGGGCER